MSFRVVKRVPTEMEETRMTTSISSEARRNQTSIIIRGRENRVPPKPDGQTDRHTYGRTERQTYIRTDGETDISIYRVASLLKKNSKQFLLILLADIFHYILHILRGLILIYQTERYILIIE